MRGHVIDDKHNLARDKIKICGVSCLEPMYNMLKITANSCKLTSEQKKFLGGRGEGGANTMTWKENGAEA